MIMSICKSVILNSGLNSYLKTSYMYFSTKHIKIHLKKFTSPENNFVYKNEFKFEKEERKITPINRNCTKRQPKTNQASKIVKKSSLRENFSPLQYKGEILYGIHPVYLALLQRKRNIYQLFLKTNCEGSSEKGNFLRRTEIEKMARTQGIKISHIDSKGMKYLAPDVVHQGVCLDVSPLPLPEWKESDETQDSSMPISLWLVLDEILDPMNIGAIVRSAYYFGIRQFFVVRGNSCKLSSTVSKASSGALEVVNIYQIENLKDFIQVKKSQGWDIVSTVAYCEDKIATLGPVVDVSELKVTKSTILILGNEGRGISSDIQKLCNSFVSIHPLESLHEGIDSLNVSVAAGVIFYSLNTKIKGLS